MRQEEIALRNQIAKEYLSEQIAELSEAEAELANFRAESGLVSLEQLDRVADTVESLRSQRNEVAATLASERTRQQQLSATLGLSPADANRVFLLQGDRAFRESIAAFGEMQAELVELTATRGRNHPSVVARQAELTTTREVLGQTLGRPIDDRLLRLFALPEDGAERETLLSESIEAHARSQGLAAQVAELDNQIAALQNRQAELNRQGERLVELDQRAQTLRVVLSSTTGALAIRETDVTATYPLVQLVIPPSLPENPISPKKSYAAIGAAFGSLFVSVAITILFLQRRRLNVLLGNALQAELPVSEVEQLPESVR